LREGRGYARIRPDSGDRTGDRAVAAATRAGLGRFAGFALAWLVIAGTHPEALILGIGAAAAAARLSLDLLPPGPPGLSRRALARLAPRFLWRSLLGGLDVARRALDPRMPLRPGWLVLPSALPPGPPRALLGGIFSLLPGTLVAGTRQDCLLVHALDLDQDIAADIGAVERALACAPPGRG
jgi:multicomponent Na+:H+ antiporter subunit E